MIEVSIETRTMGYTGQRDNWENHKSQRKVQFDGDRVRLVPSGYGVSAFEFDYHELLEAVQFIKEHKLICENLMENRF